MRSRERHIDNELLGPKKRLKRAKKIWILVYCSSFPKFRRSDLVCKSLYSISKSFVHFGEANTRATYRFLS